MIANCRAIASVLACAILLTLPFSHTSAIRNLSLAGACICAALAWRSLSVPRIPLLWLFGAWASLGLASVIWAVDPSYSAAELKAELLYAFLVFVLFFSLSDLESLERFRAALMAATALSFASVLYWAAFLPQESTAAHFNGPGMYSTYLVAVYPFALVWAMKENTTAKQNILHGLAMLVIIVGGAMTLNRMLWVAIALQSTVVLAFRPDGARARFWGRRLAVLVAAAVVAFAISVDVVSSKRFALNPLFPETVAESLAEDPRLQIWKWAGERIAEQPLSGAGFGRGAQRAAFQAQFGDGTWHAHNLLLNYGLSMGVWGVILILLLFGVVVWQLAQARHRGPQAIRSYAIAATASAAGLFVKNMTDDFFIRQNALLYWSLAGMVLGAYARWLVRRRDPASILIIRRDNIGDLVCTTPLLVALRTRFPRTWIGVYANSYNAPILTGHPAVDEVLVYRKAKHHREASSLILAAERASLLVALRHRHFDWIVLAAPNNHRRSRRLARVLSPTCVAGFVPSATNSRGLNYAVPLSETRSLHEVEAVFRLGEAFGISGSPPPLTIAVDSAERARVAAVLEAKGFAGRRPLVGLHVSARKPSARWPAERWAELACALCVREAAAVMLFWSPGVANHPLHPGDDETVQLIFARTCGVPLVPWSSAALPTLVAGLAACDRVICSDGGAMHVAAALGKPIVCLFGQSSATRWRPWSVPYRLLQPASHDVRDVTVEEVLGAYRDLFESAPRETCAQAARFAALPAPVFSGRT